MNAQHESLFEALRQAVPDREHHQCGLLAACEAIAKYHGVFVVSKQLRALVQALWTQGIISGSESNRLESMVVSAAMLEV